MRGRRPKPTALKQREGNPGKRALNKKKPRPETKIPSCPPHMLGEARKEWQRVAGPLHGLGLITELDRAVLAAYCTAYADFVEAARQLSKGKAIVRTSEGAEYQSPWVTIKRRSMDQMVRFGAELGLTPSSRARLQIEGLGTPDDKERRLFPFGGR